MLILPTQAQIQMARESRRLTIAGVIELTDGRLLTCTQHDEDLEVETGDLAGTYLSSAAITASEIAKNSDMAVDNMEISGFISDSLTFGFDADDIEAGQYAQAPFQAFYCQWDNPNAWQLICKRGFLGEIRRTAEGQFQAEWRGLFQPLQQTIGRTYSERCDVKRFGDLRCKKDVEALAILGTVTAVNSNRTFQVLLDTPNPVGTSYFSLGEVAWLTGDNAGYDRQQIKRSTTAASELIELWEEMPNLVQIGDRLRLRPGCNRTWEACKGWGNTINNRAHGRLMAGTPAIIRAP